jgi:hypothetical protein
MCGEIVKPWLRGTRLFEIEAVHRDRTGRRRALSLVIRDAFVQEH